MSNHKRLAERRARKALKRAEKKARRAAATAVSPPRDDDAATAELCSHEEALLFERNCRVFAREALTARVDAEEALDEWPDNERTRELRTLLMTLGEEAGRQAATWDTLAGRFAALARDAGNHVHVVDEELVSTR